MMKAHNMQQTLRLKVDTLEVLKTGRQKFFYKVEKLKEFDGALSLEI